LLRLSGRVDPMRATAEAFRAQEALAAASAPFSVALAQPPKPRFRRVVKEADAEAAAAPIDTASTIAIAPTTAPEPVEPPGRPRSATSVLGAAPEGGEARPLPE
jgi:hypothetical protein